MEKKEYRVTLSAEDFIWGNIWLTEEEALLFKRVTSPAYWDNVETTGFFHGSFDIEEIKK